MIVRIFNHNSIAWDEPMGMIQVDLKDFVAKKQPSQLMEKDLEATGTSAKDTKVSGVIHFELINEEIFIDHRLTTDILCMKIKQKFPQIKLKTEHLQIAVGSIMALMVLLDLGEG